MRKPLFSLIVGAFLLVGGTRGIISKNSAINIANKKAVELGYRLENLTMESCWDKKNGKVS